MRREAAWIAGLVVAALLWTLGPSLLYGTSHLLGIEGDNGAHLWGQWWVATRIVEDGVLPFFAERIWFPDGGGFFSLDTGAVLMTAPARPFVSEIVAFNLHVVLQLALAVTGGALLARRVGIDGPAAAFAGLA
ncbi:MAG: hypothetical protein VX000_18535, partial [Myxococcota bacterium]|nr:hypothetical protein [Myxococcota bacterium]